jgi:hypothetical protein
MDYVLVLITTDKKSNFVKDGVQFFESQKRERKMLSEGDLYNSWYPPITSLLVQ